MWVAGIVLLVACANVANLLLARASHRRRALAVRLALGDRLGRLVRQFLVESVLLASIGGALAVPLAWWGSLLLVRTISTGDSPAPLAVDPDWRTFAFAAVASLLTGILFGLAPAMRGTRLDPGPVMKEGMRGAGRHSHTLDRVLVGAPVALSDLRDSLRPGSCNARHAARPGSRHEGRDARRRPALAHAGPRTGGGASCAFRGPRHRRRTLRAHAPQAPQRESRI